MWPGNKFLFQNLLYMLYLSYSNILYVPQIIYLFMFDHFLLNPLQNDVWIAMNHPKIIFKWKNFEILCTLSSLS